MFLTETKFKKLFPKAKAGVYPLLAKHLPRLGFTKKEEEAMFIAQCAHESGGFASLEENLNYSADRLMVVFPKYYKSKALAQAHHRKPQLIANRVYSNRMGNGGPETNHGWKYRGRGFIGLTGRDVYIDFERWMKRDITADEVSQNLETAVLAAIYYWEKNRLKQYGGNVLAVTKRINGGTNGLLDRRHHFSKVISMM